MKAITTVSSLQLARAIDGNWSLSPSNVPDFPPMALSAKHFPLPGQAQEYAAALLDTAGVLTPETLTWRVIGRTPDGTAAYRTSWRTTIEAL